MTSPSTSKLALLMMAILCLSQSLTVIEHVEAGCIEGICHMLGLGKSDDKDEPADNQNQDEEQSAKVQRCMSDLRSQLGQMFLAEPIRVFSNEILLAIQHQHQQEELDKISLYSSIRWNRDRFGQWLGQARRPWECDALADQVGSKLNANECFKEEANAPVDQKSFNYVLSHALLQDLTMDRFIGASLACSWSKQQTTAAQGSWPPPQQMPAPQGAWPHHQMPAYQNSWPHQQAPGYQQNQWAHQQQPGHWSGQPTSGYQGSYYNQPPPGYQGSYSNQPAPDYQQSWSDGQAPANRGYGKGDMAMAVAGGVVGGVVLDEVVNNVIMPGFEGDEPSSEPVSYESNDYDSNDYESYEE